MILIVDRKYYRDALFQSGAGAKDASTGLFISIQLKFSGWEKSDTEEGESYQEGDRI